MNPSRCDVNYPWLWSKKWSVCFANPNHGKRQIIMDDNIIFKPEIIFTKNKDGWEVLNTSIYKVITQEEFSDDEAIDLVMLPDMSIKLPKKVLMRVYLLFDQ